MPNHGIILANSNFKEQDLNNMDVQIPASELMMQVWDDVAGSKKGDVKWVVRSHILNEGTQSIIKEALQKLNAGEKQLTQVTQDCDREVFQALSGTPNCKGMYPTLASHRGTQNKRVTDLYVYWEGTHNFFIAMKIGSQ